MTHAAQPHRHPAPHRDRSPIALLLFGLAAGPAAWAVQLELGYGVSSFACFPHNAALARTPPPGWAGEPAWLLALNIACLVLAFVGLAVSAICWRRTRGEKPGEAEHLLHVGEGRTRFLAACGVLTSLGFALAILFDTAAVVAVPSCWSLS
jgi:hypothetical protein